MNRKWQRVGLIAALAGSLAPLGGCAWLDKQSAEFQAFFLGTGAGVSAGLLAAALGADTEEAVLIGVLAGAAVGVATYLIASERQASREESAKIEADAKKATEDLPEDVAQKLQEEDRKLAIPYGEPKPGPQGGEPVQEYVLVSGNGEVVKEDGQTATVFSVPEKEAAEALEAQSDTQERRFARINDYDVVILPKPAQG